MDQRLRLENRRTGEVLHLRRVRDGQQIILELEGGVPAHGEGPLLHIHLSQREEGIVTSGVLTGQLGGERVTIRTGERAVFPAGVSHRWWNEDDAPLSFSGRAVPAADLDRFLQAVFAAVNAAPSGRPSPFYMAHILSRHRHTQRLVAIPALVQRILFPIVIAIGGLLGKYRGDDWPGAPAACTGAPEVDVASTR